jgi:hypothetical protein
MIKKEESMLGNISGAWFKAEAVALLMNLVRGKATDEQLGRTVLSGLSYLMTNYDPEPVPAQVSATAPLQFETVPDFSFLLKPIKS